MRQYCIDCCKKHLGSASVLEDEVNNGYPQYELYVIGHLDQAASEIQGLNAGLASAIREHRIHWMEDHCWDIPYESLWAQLDVMSKLSEDMASVMAVTEAAMGKLLEEERGVLGDTRKGLPIVTDGYIQTIEKQEEDSADEPEQVITVTSEKAPAVAVLHGRQVGHSGWMSAAVFGPKTPIPDVSEVDY